MWWRERRVNKRKEVYSLIDLYCYHFEIITCCSTVHFSMNVTNYKFVTLRAFLEEYVMPFLNYIFFSRNHLSGWVGFFLGGGCSYSLSLVISLCYYKNGKLMKNLQILLACVNYICSHDYLVF